MTPHSPTSKRFVIILGLLAGLVAFAIDISLPPIPSMVHALATSMSSGQQVVGLFMAGMAVGQIPFGLLSDRIGRLPILYAGIGLFTIAGIVTSISNTIEVMLVARFIQGLGSSAGMVLARAIVRDISSGVESARLLSIMVMIFTAAPMIAPMFGSMLTMAYGWRAPFAATAAAGLLILYGIRSSPSETHTPHAQPQILRQLVESLQQFLSHRQSVFGLLIITVNMVGIMSIVSGSVALIVELYGYPIKYFGLIFATVGIAILFGSTINRRLLEHLDTMQVIGIGTLLAIIASGQLLFIVWHNDANFWWLWGNVCLFMAATSFMLPNATALALDPVPEIAGVAASIIGTVQSLAGAASAIISSALYNGTYVNVSVIVAGSGIFALIIFSLRGAILDDKPAINT